LNESLLCFELVLILVLDVIAGAVQNARCWPIEVVCVRAVRSGRNSEGAHQLGPTTHFRQSDHSSAAIVTIVCIINSRFTEEQIMKDLVKFIVKKIMLTEVG
jgi:hypothetical protein